MKQTALLIIAAMSLVSCAEYGAEPVNRDPSEEPLHEKSTDLAWSKCVFELGKVEAIRGRNLDDLDVGATVARNQFMLDCITAYDSAVTPEQLAEMSIYASQREGRKPSDVILNSGNRSMPKSLTQKFT